MMKKARRAPVGDGAKIGKGKMAANSQAPVSAPVSEQRVAKAPKYTSGITFLDVGADENKNRYLRWCVGEVISLVSIATLIRDPREAYVRLQRDGVILLENAARSEFLERLAIEAAKKPTFSVAIRPGLFKGKFHFPDDLTSRNSTSAFYPDEQHLQIYRKFRRAGSPAGWNSLIALAKGNTRMILGLALTFSGLVCGAFGLDPPGIQFKGEGGAGKTPLARIISAVWGWDPDGSTRLGFGTSWKMKRGGLEVVAEAYNHTMIFLDEMSKATEEQIEFVMTIAQGQGTARMTELRRRIWSMSILSTSNRSVVDLMKQRGFEFDSAYVDRLMDVPAPSKVCILENLHNHPDIAAFFAHACNIAENNHGSPGRDFSRQFTNALKANKAALEARVKNARKDYVDAAANIKSSWRDLGRTHGRFATIFASGLLASEFGVLPLSKGEILAAILKCEHDHVALIESEVNRLGVLTSTAAEPANAVQSANNTIVPTKKSPLSKLNDYLNSNIPNGLIDLRNPATELPQGHDHAKAAGYIGIHDNKTEVWLSNDRFEKISGGKREGNDLKKTLAGAGRLMMWQRGNGATSKVVQRRIACLGEQSVVAFRPSSKVLACLPKLKMA